MDGSSDKCQDKRQTYQGFYPIPEIDIGLVGAQLSLDSSTQIEHWKIPEAFQYEKETLRNWSIRPYDQRGRLENRVYGQVRRDFPRVNFGYRCLETIRLQLTHYQLEVSGRGLAKPSHDCRVIPAAGSQKSVTRQLTIHTMYVVRFAREKHIKLRFLTHLMIVQPHGLFRLSLSSNLFRFVF